MNQATDRYPAGHVEGCLCSTCAVVRSVDRDGLVPPHFAYMPVVQRRTNGLAIASLVLGITWVWWIGSLLAIIFGIIAHRQINESNGTQTGGGMATAGIVLGWLGIAAFVLFMVFAVALSATSSPSPY